ncbi:hypothetical protein Hanom_Chr13g01226051 [Helianthus anomalus]
MNKKGKKSESEFHSVRNLLRESWELASILNFLQFCFWCSICVDGSTF